MLSEHIFPETNPDERDIHRKKTAEGFHLVIFPYERSRRENREKGLRNLDMKALSNAIFNFDKTTNAFFKTAIS